MANQKRSQWELKVKLTKLHESAGKCQRPNRDWFWFCIWLVKRVVQVFWTNKWAKLRKTFDTQLTIAPILIYLHFQLVDYCSLPKIRQQPAKLIECATNSPQKIFFPTLSTIKPKNGEAQAEMINTTLQTRSKI